jgi:transposase
MRPNGTPTQLEQRRRKAVALRKQGLKQAEIARRLNTTPRSVRRWLRAHRERGPKALAAKPTPGRPSHLTVRQRRGLVACLLRGACHWGFATDLWTCPRIAQLIERRYGAHYHVAAIPRLMAGLGFSPAKAAMSGSRTGRRGRPPLDGT